MHTQKGFSLVEGLLIVFVLSIIGFGGYYVWTQQDDEEPNINKTVQQEPVNNQQEEQATEELTTYIIENEGLSFSYNPEATTTESRQPRERNGTLIEGVHIKTGKVGLDVLTGIDGIGGQPRCIDGEGVDDRDSCAVVDTIETSYLGEQKILRLIEANVVTNCGGQDSPSCAEVDTTQEFFVDAYSGEDDVIFGPCCSLLSNNGRNIGGLADFAGRVRISLEVDESIQNENVFTNEDFLNTLKIIESFNYPAS